MIYTFNHVEVDGIKSLQISYTSDTEYLDEKWGLTQQIESSGEVFVDFKDWRPIKSSSSLSWDGDVAGWHKTKSEYGNGFVSWSEETPAGSRTNDITFIQTFV